MVQIINKKTVCRVEVLINNKTINERILNIPTYPEFKNWQTKIENRKSYLNKKVNEIRADYDLLGVCYEVAVYVMSKLN